MELTTIENKLIENKEKRNQLKNDYESKMNDLKKEYEECLRLKTLYMTNVDMEKVMLAEKTLDFRKGFNRFDKRVVNRAIDDIATDKNEMRTKYFGIKDYAHFRNQEIQCQYFYGPRHGYVVFSVGLKINHRNLEEDEKNACLYYLNLLKSDEDFRKKAKGA